MSLDAFDWTIIIVYLIGMIGLSFYLARGQKTGRDYYLGDNETAPLPIALSSSGLCGFCRRRRDDLATV
jgi:Na+/proline symporter